VEHKKEFEGFMGWVLTIVSLEEFLMNVDPGRVKAMVAGQTFKLRRE
jgi:hypothetical protein